MQSEKCQVNTHLKSIKIIQILRVCCEIWTPVIIILLSLLFRLVDASMVVWTTFNKMITPIISREWNGITNTITQTEREDSDRYK